jgi:hypothetical protein
VSIAQTDNSGRYRLDDIPPGRYYVVAGPLSSQTFHPGTLQQSGATILTMSQDRRPLTGIDFALNVVATLPDSPVIAAGRIVTEDGNPLPITGGRPATREHVAIVGGNTATIEIDGTFRTLSMSTGISAFLVVGFPGYIIKSVKYGDREFDPFNVQVDGKSPPTSFVLTLGFEPLARLPKVTARGSFLNIARELKATSLALLSMNPMGPTLESPLRPDGSFEFSNIPIGVYRAGVRSAAGNTAVSSTFAAIGQDVSNLTINLRNNPFPEFERVRPARSPFTDGKRTEITGIATARLVRISPESSSYIAAYFRMDVKDERGNVTSWAVYVDKDWQVPNIHVGDTLTVPGIVSTDGTNRLSADPF